MNFFFWDDEIMVIGCGGWLCMVVVGGCSYLIEQRETGRKRQRNKE